MAECFRCGVSGDKVRLYDAISNKGIVKICNECNSVEKLPLIRKATDEQIAESQRQKSVRDMLTGMNRGKLLAGKEMSLRELVDRNLKERREKLPADLIDNFNWTVQRIRRARKITREQFAKGIGESEATVRMVEQGILPSNDYKIISKIENYLGVTLRKKEGSEIKMPEPRRAFSSSVSAESPRRLGFDRTSAERLKIADLKDMKKKQEEKEPIDSWEEERDESGKEIEEDITDEDFSADEEFKK